MKWDLDALKMLARNPTVPGMALADAISEIVKLQRKLDDQIVKYNNLEADFGKYQQTKRANVEVGQINAPCIWHYDDYECFYTTSCGKAVYFEEGTAEENEVTFCHNCGHPVQIVMPETDTDAEEE